MKCTLTKRVINKIMTRCWHKKVKQCFAFLIVIYYWFINVRVWYSIMLVRILYICVCLGELVGKKTVCEWRCKRNVIRLEVRVEYYNYLITLSPSPPPFSFHCLTRRNFEKKFENSKDESLSYYDTNSFQISLSDQYTSTHTHTIITIII